MTSFIYFFVNLFIDLFGQKIRFLKVLWQQCNQFFKKNLVVWFNKIKGTLIQSSIKTALKIIKTYCQKLASENTAKIYSTVENQSKKYTIPSTTLKVMLKKYPLKSLAAHKGLNLPKRFTNLLLGSMSVILN